jgi:hypothetical protein
MTYPGRLPVNAPHLFVPMVVRYERRHVLLTCSDISAPGVTIVGDIKSTYTSVTVVCMEGLLQWNCVWWFWMNYTKECWRSIMTYVTMIFFLCSAWDTYITWLCLLWAWHLMYGALRTVASLQWDWLNLNQES